MSEKSSTQTPGEVQEESSPCLRAWAIFREDKLALCGLAGISLLVSVAVFAPFLANGRPWLFYQGGHLSSPALRFLFAPDSTEQVVEKIFNYVLLLLPLLFLGWLLSRFTGKKVACWGVAISAVLLLLPFVTMSQKLDKTDWRAAAAALKQGDFAVFAPLKYGPFENVVKPYQKFSTEHPFGSDEIGRDVMSRMVYGARVSLAVGILATVLAMAIGVAVGLLSGYLGGLWDIVVMRVVEIVICFPTFLLLLILMMIMMDRKYQQSILLVIAVLGVTGWTGLTRLVRGEVLKQRVLPYILACETLGLSRWRIMVFHLLPNVSAPILVSFSFSVAGCILAESGLSFLGFGVRAPTASWGELLRQAFSDPFNYYHLTVCPGAAIFIAVCSFNLVGEGLRRVLDPKS